MVLRESEVGMCRSLRTEGGERESPSGRRAPIFVDSDGEPGGCVTGRERKKEWKGV